MRALGGAPTALRRVCQGLEDPVRDCTCREASSHRGAGQPAAEILLAAGVSRWAARQEQRASQRPGSLEAARRDRGRRSGRGGEGRRQRQRYLCQRQRRQGAASHRGDVVEFGKCVFRLSRAKHASDRTLHRAADPIDRTQVLLSSHMTAFGRATRSGQRPPAAALRSGAHGVRSRGQLIQTTTSRSCASASSTWPSGWSPPKPERSCSLTRKRTRALGGAAGQEDGHARHLRQPHDCRSSDPRQRGGPGSDALVDSRWSKSESVALSGVRSLMCVPLSWRRTCTPAHVSNSSTAGAFSQADLELVTGIGSAPAWRCRTPSCASPRRGGAHRSRSAFLSRFCRAGPGNRVDLKRGGEERDVTVMFADIRGFTT